MSEGVGECRRVSEGVGGCRRVSEGVGGCRRVSEGVGGVNQGLCSEPSKFLNSFTQCNSFTYGRVDSPG